MRKSSGGSKVSRASNTKRWEEARAAEVASTAPGPSPTNSLRTAMALSALARTARRREWRCSVPR
eukprot:2901229-Lingulodinium_polyedra.AAC.1